MKRFTSKNKDNTFIEARLAIERDQLDGTNKTGYNKTGVFGYSFDLYEYVRARENIEEELGIDLVTLCKHRTLAEIIGYVWYKIEHPKSHKEVIIKRQVCTFQDNGVVVVKSYDEDYVCGLHIKDYGKTWALTQEELL